MRWPEGMEPERATVHARNEIFIAAEPVRVWRWLRRARRWPEWYSNCSWIRFRDGAGPDLHQGTAFVFKIFGVRVRCVVTTFEPFREIGWDATAFGLNGYHGWELSAVDNGSRVVTEETQTGPLTRAGRWYLRRALLREHQIWLESLGHMAMSGEPD